jgi:hypothetical protein
MCVCVELAAGSIDLTFSARPPLIAPPAGALVTINHVLHSHIGQDCWI